MSEKGKIKVTALKIVAAVGLLLGTGALAWGAEFATKEEAVAMVKKAAALVKQDGEKAYASFDAKGGYADRDLYVVVYGLDGKVLAHGANAKLIGKDMSDAQDVDGKYYIKDRVALAAKQSEFWQDYKFTNPVSKKVEPKQMYCEKHGEVAVCAGVYVR